MSVIAEIIDTLEIKIARLFSKIQLLQKNELELKTKISEASTIIAQQSQEIDKLKKQNDALKIANSLLGSEENKRDTKLKINSLIREIDYCIAQLSE